MAVTPRLWEAVPARGITDAASAEEAVGGLLVASTDDVELYGPVVFEFSLVESIERGVLARFEIDVLEIQDPEAPGTDTSTEEQRGRRLGALQTALLKRADTTGVRSFMTFHSRTPAAMAFARALSETAAELYETEPATSARRAGCPRTGVDGMNVLGRTTPHLKDHLRDSRRVCTANHTISPTVATATPPAPVAMS
ncbi:hypothetical protein ACWF9B_22100 [Streptomyces sp. NPDC055089]